MILALIAVLLVVVVGVAFVAMKGKSGGATPSATKSSAKTSAKTTVAVEDDEESTTVRVIGHRVVRLERGVRVGNEIPIVARTMVGSASNCQIRLGDPQVSEKHLELRLENGKAYAIDNGSDDGTDVNGLRLECFVPHALKDGDRIRVGTAELLYKSG